MKIAKILITILCLISWNLAISEKIYKWKDENGTIHYSKKPRNGDEQNVQNQQISISKEKKGNPECCLLVREAISAMLNRTIYPKEKKFQSLFSSADFNVDELNNFVGSKASYRGKRKDIARLGFNKCMSAGFRFCRSNLSGAMDSEVYSKSGSGFFVTDVGDIVTNEHVVSRCKKIEIQPSGLEAKLIDKDSKYDLALIRIDKNSDSVAKIRVNTPVLGEQVIVAGYPYKGLLSSGIKITSGIVSSLAGLQNDEKLIQITAPIQPGNSGGPLIDQYGNIIGVIVSKLNSEFMLRNFNDIPQNINFAIKATYLKKFLYRNKVEFKEVHSESELELTKISQQAQEYTVEVNCLN
jgi:S1-C subfamily serine protease